MKGFKKVLLACFSVLILLITWEILVSLDYLNSVYFPKPSLILLKLVDLLKTGRLLIEIKATLSRIITGFIIAAPIGILIAILCYNIKNIEYIVLPLVELIRNIAPLALLPVFMLLFGIGFLSKIAVIIWVSWIPVFLNTLQGIKSVDPLYIKAAKVLGSNKFNISMKVILPSAAPFILSGLRLGVGSAFLVIVAAEMLGSNTGLGFYIIETSQTFKIVEMYAAIFMIAIIGIVINWIFIIIAKYISPWHNF